MIIRAGFTLPAVSADGPIFAAFRAAFAAK